MGSKLIPGYNDLQSQYPDIAAEWDFDENFPKTPSNIAYSCNTKYKWICPQGHKYDASPNSRTNKKSGCKYCSNKAVLVGFNDLPTTHPEIASEWDYTLNGDAKPEDYVAGSDKSFYWICNNGHESYKSLIKDRANGRSCRLCGYKRSGDAKRKTIIQREGSLLDHYPELAEEWDYQLNTKGPHEYTCHSNEKVMWVCSWCHQKWPAKVNARVSEGSGCPYCNNKSKTSFPEQALLFYIRKLFDDAVGHYTDIFSSKMSLDIYIPSLLTAIEYDGTYWHDNKKNIHDKTKYEYCKEHNIYLIRVREAQPLENEEYCDLTIIRNDYASMDSLNDVIIKTILHLATVCLDVDCERDKGEIKNQYIATLQRNSLQAKFPQIASEWNVFRNGGLTPDKVSAGSGEKYWWTCSECGYEYQKRINERTVRNSGCKKCSSRKKAEKKRTENLIVGVNDLETLLPDLIQQWDFSKNIGLSPQNYTCGSSEEVWWICDKCKKSWQVSIYVRASGHGCPDCGRIQAGEKQKVASIRKYGSLAQAFPDIAAQWDYTRNKGTPDDYSPIDRSGDFHWICNCGTEWESNIFNLTHSKYIGCRSCRHKKIRALPNSMKKEITV